MPRYKFHIEKETLPEEEIQETKDFRKLVYRYQKGTRPLFRFPLFRYRNRRFWMGLFLVLLIAYLIYLFG